MMITKRKNIYISQIHFQKAPVPGFMRGQIFLCIKHGRERLPFTSNWTCNKITWKQRRCEAVKFAHIQPLFCVLVALLENWA